MPTNLPFWARSLVIAGAVVNKISYGSEIRQLDDTQERNLKNAVTGAVWRCLIYSDHKRAYTGHFAICAFQSLVKILSSPSKQCCTWRSSTQELFPEKESPNTKNRTW